MSVKADKVITAKQVFIRATDLANLGYECLTYCETLFIAIQNAKTLDQAKSLASVGRYLSTDHANIFDCDREQLEIDKALEIEREAV